MKNIKKIMIILIMLISTGCTIKYEIEITDNLEIKEQINVQEKNELFEKLGTNNQTYIDMMYNLYSTNELYKAYDLKKIIGDNSSGINATKEYKSLEEYLNHDSVRKTMFRFTNIDEENGIITLKSTHFKYEQIFNELETDFPYDEIKVIVKLPFEVTETNADIKETEKGEYTWIINKNTTLPEIKISFKKKLSLNKKISNYIKKYIMPILICGGIIITLFVILFINNKRVNKL